MACDPRTAQIACIALPAFPLQLQLHEQPQWREHSCAVIDSDKPQGRLLWVNSQARCRRILPGMRYAAALSLDRDLRAAVVPRARIEQTVERLVDEVLTDFSPRVEPSATEPGIFWLDLAGMSRLFPDLESWAAGLVRRLDEEGFVCRLVVGWSRFHCYALAVGADLTSARGGDVGADLAPARGSRTSVPAPTGEGTRPSPTDRSERDVPMQPREGTRLSPTQEDSSGQTLRVLLLRSPAQEYRFAAKVSLGRLDLDPAVRDALDDLGVSTLGEFTALPGEGIERRFGRAVAQLHQQACGRRQPPLEAEEIEDEVSERAFLEESIRDLPRLMLWVEMLLIACLQTLAGRGELASELALELVLENGDTMQETLRPAEPTNDAGQWLELLRLRLDDARLGEGVQEVVLSLSGKRVPPGQMELFAIETRRDLTAANRALARVRAELGEAAVRRAETRDGHLPEARFAWQPFERLEEAEPARVAEARLIRRFFARPQRLPPRPRQEPDGWLLRGLTDTPVDKVRGPFILAGGWWRKPVQREYHYAETRSGEMLWAYYDRLRRRWFLQGRIE